MGPASRLLPASPPAQSEVLSEALSEDRLACREYCVIDLYDWQGDWVESLFRFGNAHAVTLDLRQLTPLLAKTRGAVLLVRHGHPSGRAEPSAADLAATRALAALARLLDMVLHDHVIEAGTARFSFREAGLL